MAFVMQNTISARQIILSVEEFVAKNSISAEQFFSIYGEIYQYFIFKSVFNDKTLLVKQMYKCVCVLAA